MDVKPGYKRTEVGVIPEDWELTPLGALFGFQNGVNADKERYGSGIPFANVLEVITKTHLRDSDIPGLVILTPKQEAIYSLQIGDCLFNRTSETQEEVGLASVYIGKRPAVFGGFVIRARPTTSALDNGFLGYAARSPLIRPQIVSRGQGAVRANIGQSDLRTVLLPVPTKAEQEAIAGALSDADALIESLERLIAKKRAIKRGAMQELLTGKTRLPGFQSKPGYKRTEVGLIPEDWEVERLRDFATLMTGPFGTALKASEYSQSDGILLISVGEIREGFLRVTEDTPRIAGDVIRRLPQYVLRAGDVVFGRKGGVERSALVRDSPQGYFLGSDGIRVRPEDRAFPAFVAVQFQVVRVKTWLLQNAIGTTMPSLNQGILGNVLTPLPASKVEQEAIAGALSDMDTEIETLERKLDKARLVKRGMMQELLTGRIRLG